MSIRAARFAFLGFCLAYFAAVLLAGANPGARAWGLHSLGFLRPGVKSALISLWVCAGALTLWGCVSKGATAGGASTASARAVAAGDTGSPARLPALRRLGPAGIALAALSLGAIFYALRARTHLLGDGTVWLTILKTGQHHGYSEPLAAAVWIAFGSIVRSLAPSPDASAFGLLSVTCGVASFLVCFATAKHLVADPETKADAVFLLMTLGFTQLYCGYLESYPPVVLLILGYLWLGLRSLNRNDRFAAAPIVLSLATASHFLCLYLWPSYLYLVFRRERATSRRAVWCLAPAVLSLALAWAAGSRPAGWLESWRIAARAATRPAASSAAGLIHTMAQHNLDLANEAVLLMPIALLLAAAGLWVPSVRQWLRSPGPRFLAVATLSGFVAAFALVLPAPAVDWDLYALFFVPAALLSVGLGTRLLGVHAPLSFRLGVAGLSLGAVLPYLLVNADEAASLRRFQTLIGPGTRISEQGRAYPNSVLAEFYEDRGDYLSALLYASRAYRGEPTNPRYSVKLAGEHFHLGLFAEAARLYREAIARGWDRAATRHDLGLAYAYSGRTLDALTELRIAAGRPDGARPDYLHDLGVAYVEAGYPDSARVTWERVLTRWPGYAPTVSALRNRRR